MATVSKTPRFSSVTLASATDGPFDLGIRLFDEDALEVYLNGTLQSSGWTLSATFSDGYTDDATVTFDDDLAAGDTLVFQTTLVPNRGNDYLNGDPLLTQKLNNELGRVWSALGDLYRDTQRGLRLLGGAAMPAIPAVAGKAVVVGADGKIGLANYPEIGTSAQMYDARNASNAGAAAALSNGTMVWLGGFAYLVNSAKTGVMSATYDLGVDGLEPWGDYCYPEHFGAAGDASNPALIAEGITDIFAAGTDDTDAINRALACGKALRITKFHKVTNLTYPQGDGRESWSQDYMPSIVGVGRDKCGFLCVATSGYFFAGYGIDESPATQYLGGVFTNFRVQGNGSLTSNVGGLAIVNARGVRLEGIRVDGFASGAGLKLYAFGKGGTFGTDIIDCQFGDRIVSDNGTGSHDVKVGGQFWLSGNQIGVLIEGPGGGSNGKCNTINMNGLYIKNVLDAGVVAQPSTFGGTAVEYVSADVHIDGFHIFTTAVKIEYKRQIISYTSNSVTIAVDPTNNVQGLYDGSIHTGHPFKLYVESGDNKDDLYVITSDVISGSERTITVAGTFSSAFVNDEVDEEDNDTVTIEYGSTALNTKYAKADAPMNGREFYPTGISLSWTRNYYIGTGQFEEVRSRACIFTEEAMQRFTSLSSEANTYAHDIVDYTGVGRQPGLVMGHTDQGVNGYTSRGIITGDINHNTPNTALNVLDEPFGFRHPAVNDSGGTLETGDVCMWDNSTALKSLKKTDGTVCAQPVVVSFTRLGETSADGTLVYYRATGNEDVKVNGTVVKGEPLIAGASGRAVAYSGYSATTVSTWPHPDQILGWAMQPNASGDGVINVRLAPR